MINKDHRFSKGLSLASVLTGLKIYPFLGYDNKEDANELRRVFEHKLFFIQSLIFLIPFLIVYYLFSTGAIPIIGTHLFIFASILVLILAGFIILREIFAKFLFITTELKQIKADTQYLKGKNNKGDELDAMVDSVKGVIENFKDLSLGLEMRNNEMYFIMDFFTHLGNSNDLNEILNHLLDNALCISGAKIGAVYTFDHNKQGFNLFSARGLENKDSPKEFIKIEGHVAKEISAKGKIISITKINEIFTQWHRERKAKNNCFLLSSRNRLLGVLNILNTEPEKAIDKNKMQILNLIINWTGNTLEKMMFYSETKVNIKNLEDGTTELIREKAQLEQEMIGKEEFEYKLGKKNKLLESALNYSTTMPTFTADQQGNILFENKMAIGCFDNFTIKSRKLEELFPSIMNDFRLSIVKKKKAFKKIIEKKAKNGHEFNIGLNLLPVYGDNGELIGIIGILEDLIKSQESVSSLMYLQQINVFKTIAGGIAHNFNNIFTIIIGNTELIAYKVKETESIKENVQSVFNAITKAKELVDHILCFYNTSDEGFVPIIIQPVIFNILNILRPSVPSKIEIRQKIDPIPWVISANPSQIYQILITLFSNAYLLMEHKGGIVEVSLLRLEINEDSELLDNEMKPGPYIQLSLSSKGVGIPYDIIREKLQPIKFGHSMNEKEKAIRQGLTSVTNIVRAHKGIFKVYNKAKDGTTFDIYLPIIEKH